VAGVVVGIARPNKAVIGHVVPFLARDFAGFATDAHSWISEETNLNIVAHVRMPALVRAVCAFTDHGTIGAAFTLFLPSRGRRRFCRP
jgi:hypothetical protein